MKVYWWCGLLVAAGFFRIDVQPRTNALEEVALVVLYCLSPMLVLVLPLHLLLVRVVAAIYYEYEHST